MKCPVCKQEFSDNVAEVHIPWCKEQKALEKRAARAAKENGLNDGHKGSVENESKPPVKPERDAQGTGEGSTSSSNQETK